MRLNRSPQASLAATGAELGPELRIRFGAHAVIDAWIRCRAERMGAL